MEKKILEDEQFVISYELLHVLHWLMKHEKEALSELITKSFITGFEEKLKQQDMFSQIQFSEDTQNSIVEFFAFLEKEIENISNQESTKHIMQQKTIIKTLEHIDPKRCDYETIKSTVIATAEKVHEKNETKAKELFLKELLKQWSPEEHNEIMVN